MLGEDTLFLTPKGFKKLKELEKYDEVMNSDGHFTYIKRLSPWKQLDKCVILSTGERICCDDSLLWDLHGDGEFKYTDELDLDRDNESCAKMHEITRVRARNIKNSYEKSITIPRDVPYKYFTASTMNKLEFLAGLIDSPMCELGDAHGIYVFYTFLENLSWGIVTLARSLGFGVLHRKYKGVYIVRVYINKYKDILPVRDPYKACYKYAGVAYSIILANKCDIPPSEVNFGRAVELNDGNCLVGYSLVSVA